MQTRTLERHEHRQRRSRRTAEIQRPRPPLWDPPPSSVRCTRSTPRLGWIDGKAALAGKKGARHRRGGGILAEGMAALGAEVTGIDLSERRSASPAWPFRRAATRSIYRHMSAEALAEESPGRFDVVTCMKCSGVP